MKKLFCLFFVCLSLGLSAQQNGSGADDRRGFRTENMFLGGGLNLGFSSGSFTAGLLPEAGYSLTNWLDMGVAFNLNYYSLKAEYNFGYRQRSFNYGGGVFARLYPVNMVFVQIQPEQNWIRTNLRNMSTGQEESVTQKASSLLAGIGYANRVVGQSNFYIMVGMDLLRDFNSPYRDAYNRATPVIRSGFNIYLKPSRK